MRLWMVLFSLLALSGRVGAADDAGYWTRWSALPIAFDYVCGEIKDGTTWSYLICNDPRKAGRSIAIRQPLTNAGLGSADILFSTDLVTNFPSRSDPSRPAGSVSASRTALYHYPDVGYVCLASVFAGTSYQPGRHPLLPVILSSPTGEPGSWRYRGRLRGEPEAHENAQRVWSDNGGLVALPDGRWRVYLNGYGPTLAAAEADSLDGPWTFLRGADGERLDVAAAYAPADAKARSPIFPFVLQVAADEYHLWISQHWPVQAVWHFTSADGLAFEPYGQQPEVITQDIGASIKGVRAFVSEDRQTIHGWMPIYRSGTWQIHAASMPVGLQPEE